MQQQSRFPAVIVIGLSIYFTLVFGFGAAKALLLPLRGHGDDPTTAAAFFAGHAFGFGPSGLTLTAAAIGATKLAIAGFFLLYLFERAYAAICRVQSEEHETLDVAVMCGAVLTVLLAVPAWSAGDLGTARTHLANLMLALVAIGVSLYERYAPARRPPAPRAEYLEQIEGGDQAAAAEWPAEPGEDERAPNAASPLVPSAPHDPVNA